MFTVAAIKWTDNDSLLIKEHSIQLNFGAPWLIYHCTGNISPATGGTPHMNIIHGDPEQSSDYLFHLRHLFPSPCAQLYFIYYIFLSSQTFLTVEFLGRKKTNYLCWPLLQLTCYTEFLEWQ